MAMTRMAFVWSIIFLIAGASTIFAAPHNSYHVMELYKPISSQISPSSSPRYLLLYVKACPCRTPLDYKRPTLNHGLHSPYKSSSSSNVQPCRCKQVNQSPLQNPLMGLRPRSNYDPYTQFALIYNKNSLTRPLGTGDPVISFESKFPGIHQSGGLYANYKPSNYKEKRP